MVVGAVICFNFCLMVWLAQFGMVIGQTSNMDPVRLIVVPYKMEASDTNLNTHFLNFYRAMHFSAKHGLAIACRLSVRL